MPSYRAWFGSQVLSASGTMTQAVGMSWLILSLTGRVVDVAWMSVATMLPLLVLSPRTGALADRVDRRRLLMVTQSIFVALSVALFLLSASGHAALWSLLLIAGLSGVNGALDAPARQVYVVDLVGPGRLASAVGLYEVILNASRILGPAVGGVLLAVSGPSACFAANGVSYLAPLWALTRFRPPNPVHREAAPRQRGATRAGAAYVWSSPVLRSCLVLAAASGVLFNSALLFLPLATRSLHLGGAGYGVLVASFGIGALPGALLAARTGEPDGRRVRLLALGTAASMALTGLAPDAAAAYPLMCLTGFVSIWFIAAANTLVQLRSLPELRGRVMGLWTMALPGTNPLTGLAAAVIADRSSPRVAFACGAALIAVAALSGWRALDDGRSAAAPVRASATS